MAVAKNEKVYVAGHRGMVGSAVLRALAAKGYQNVVTRTSIELDLRDQAATQAFFAAERPDVVILAAAKVGGIAANQRYPADFIYDNIAIATHVIRSAHNFGVSKLVNLGSSCIYPREAAQPIEETALLTSALESTNRPYAIAKIAAIEMCDSFRTQYGNDFISLMPCNLYGPGDNFDLGTSHVIPALLRKFMIAASEGAEGTGVVAFRVEGDRGCAVGDEDGRGHELSRSGTPEQAQEFRLRLAASHPTIPPSRSAVFVIPRVTWPCSFMYPKTSVTSGAAPL